MAEVEVWGKMNVLITCEFSGQVSGAFREAGHNAYSCDYLPSESDPLFHLQFDALAAITHGLYRNSRKLFRPWDLIGIHYTCTYFTLSGVQWLYLPRMDGKPGRSREPDPLRWERMNAAADEFAALWGAAKATGAKVYFENPRMHPQAQAALCARIPGWQKDPTQFIQPYQHGHGETKATGLWLHGLPPLVPTNEVAGRVPRVHHASPGKDRWKERSRTLPGVARAMAAQWGGHEILTWE